MLWRGERGESLQVLRSSWRCGVPVKLSRCWMVLSVLTILLGQAPSINPETFSPNPSRSFFQRILQLQTEQPEILRPPEVDVRRLTDCQPGYPRLAAFIDSDENFLLYRRFGYLQARLLLNKQDELRELEQELDMLDNKHAGIDRRILMSRERDVCHSEEREKLLGKIEAKLKDYGELLILARDLVEFDQPSAKDYRNVKRYIDQIAPLCEMERYIYYREDIVALKPERESAWLDSLVEGLLQKLVCRLTQLLFSTPDLRHKLSYKDTGIILYSRDRIGIVVLTIILIMIVAILIVPVYLLQKMPPDEEESTSMIVILMSFTLLFSLVISNFTRAKRHEILAAAAAYCAVLVVFVGNVNQAKASTRE